MFDHPFLISFLGSIFLGFFAGRLLPGMWAALGYVAILALPLQFYFSLGGLGGDTDGDTLVLAIVGVTAGVALFGGTLGILFGRHERLRRVKGPS
jgi:hypothetical protein